MSNTVTKSRTSLKFAEENYPDYYKNCADLNDKYLYSSYVVSRNGISSECGLYFDLDTDVEVEKLKAFLIQVSEKICGETIKETQQNFKIRTKKIRNNEILNLYSYQTVEEFQTLNFKFYEDKIAKEFFWPEECLYRMLYCENILARFLESIFTEREIKDFVDNCTYKNFHQVLEIFLESQQILADDVDFVDLLRVDHNLVNYKQFTLYEKLRAFLSETVLKRNLVIDSQQKTFKATINKTTFRDKLQTLSLDEIKVFLTKLRVFFIFTRICLDFEFYLKYAASKKLFKQKYSVTSIDLKKHFRDFNEFMLNSKHQVSKHKLFSRYLNIFIAFIFRSIYVFEDRQLLNANEFYAFLQTACKCVVMFVDKYGTSRELAKLFYSAEFRNYFKDLSASAQWNAQAIKDCQETLKIAKNIKNKTAQAKSSVQITKTDDNSYEILHKDGSVSLMRIGKSYKEALKIWSDTIDYRLLETTQSLSSFITILKCLIIRSPQIDILCAKPLFDSALCLSFPYQKTLEVFLLDLLESVNKGNLKYSVETQTLYHIIQTWLLICVVYDAGKDARKRIGISVPRPIVRKIFQQHFRDIIKNRNYLKQFIKSESAYEDLVRWMPKSESAFFFDNLCKSNLMTTFIKQPLLLEKFLLDRKQETTDLMDLFSSFERNLILKNHNKTCKEIQFLHRNSAILKRCTFSISNGNKFVIKTFKN